MNLYNSGFLGEHFNWWIGQIADDSTWRDNILTGKHGSPSSVSGWGYRYKVRIVGLHDQDEEPLRSEELPWAQVMYPITGGGGQTSASQTPNLRQGMFVFGFFLDGQDQQVPVIMGVLGNNAKTIFSYDTSLTGGKNFSAQSGNANTQIPKTGTTKERVPAESLVTTGSLPECAPPPPGVKLDKFGLRPDIPPTKQQLQDAQSARTEADQKGLTGIAKEEFVRQKVAEGIKNWCKNQASPSSGPIPNPTKESTDGVHQLSAGDVIREEKYQEKIPLMKPDNKVESALKSIQVVLDNITQKIDKYLNAALSYIDAVSNIISDIRSIIANAACEIAKYMKIVFDKIMEYVLKLLNKELTKIVSAIPSSMRYMFGDMKEIITELIVCLYNKIIDGLCGLIQAILDDILNLDEARKKIIEKEDIKTSPMVPICTAESMVGRVLHHTKSQINDANASILNNINAFLDDIQSQLAGVSGAISDIKSLLGTIDGNLTAALNFQNIKLNVLGCQLSPNIAVSDFYTFARGGAAQPDSQQPSASGVQDAVNKATPISAPPEVPFVEPTKATPNITISDSSTQQQIQDRTGSIA